MRLAEAARGVGERWAQGWRSELQGQGRAAAGGWPGTLGEARARVMAFFAEELDGEEQLTPDELGWATKAAYASARRDWLARAEPGD